MNVISLPEKDDFVAAVEQIKRNKAAHIDIQSVLAEVRKASYEAHLAQGFTPEQSLILCQKTIF